MLPLQTTLFFVSLTNSVSVVVADRRYITSVIVDHYSELYMIIQEVYLNIDISTAGQVALFISDTFTDLATHRQDFLVSCHCFIFSHFDFHFLVYKLTSVCLSVRNVLWLNGAS